MFFVVQFGRNPVHIMIVYKRVQLSAAVNTAICIKLSPNCMSNLKIIMVVMPRIKPLMQFVIRHGMQHIAVDPARIIPVYYLAHQPEFRFYRIRQLAHFLHKIKIEHICTVKAYPVDIKFFYPEADHIEQIIAHRPVPEI